MRNLMVYPITKEETKAYFQMLSDQYEADNNPPIGSLAPSMLGQLLDNFDQIWYEVYDGRWPFATTDKAGKEYKHD